MRLLGPARSRTLVTLLAFLVAALVVLPPAAPSYAATAPGITLSGHHVTGAKSSSGAPKIGPGVYLTDSPVGDAVAYFLVPRTVNNSTIRVGAALQPREENEGIELSLLSLDNQNDCGSASVTADFGDWSDALYTTAVTSRGDDRDASCLSDDSLLLEVSASGSPDKPRSTPVRLVVSEEPPPQHTAGLPATAPDTQSWASLPATGHATTVAPGHSFDDAPALGDGFHSAAITPGESQLFKVHLDWGQRLQAEVRLAKVSDDTSQLLFDSFEVQILSPTLDVASADAKESDGDLISGSDSPSDSGESQARAVTAPVRYNNAASDADGVSGASIPGDYYVLVEMTRGDKDTERKLDYDLVTEVTGDAGSGAPSYAEGRLVIGGQSSTGRSVVRVAVAAALGLLGLGSLATSGVLLRQRRRWAIPR